MNLDRLCFISNLRKARQSCLSHLIRFSLSLPQPSVLLNIYKRRLMAFEVTEIHLAIQFDLNLLSVFHVPYLLLKLKINNESNRQLPTIKTNSHYLV